jgi:hypothetical protein
VRLDGAGTARRRDAAARARAGGEAAELSRIRLDADTVEKPGALADALRRFSEGDRVVLVGTQMVSKGHHFPGVALAAVVDADTGLGLPDFRAEERTFQLLTQLAGRSGRDAPGRVLVQTFQPDSRAIELAARHDVPRFLAGELERRRALGYPPFKHLVRIVVTGPEPDAPLQALAELKSGLPGDLLGPAPLLRLARQVPRAARREDGPARARSPRRRAACSRPRRRRCGAPASAWWSTSIRRASEQLTSKHGHRADAAVARVDRRAAALLRGDDGSVALLLPTTHHLGGRGCRRFSRGSRRQRRRDRARA